MGSFFVSTCLVFLAVQGNVIPSESFSPQEAFFLRRMTEFWKDKDFALVKKQIEEFLKTNPSSGIDQSLQTILADILYHEHAYQQALDIYRNVSDPALQKKIEIRKCQCLYLLGYYDEVITLLTPALVESSPHEMQFLLADSLFRKLQIVSDTEKQSALALQAKPLLKALYETSYQAKVLFPLAEIHRILDENSEACTLFLQLAEQMPEKKEEILLQVAALQMAFDKNSAIATYQTVVNLGKPKAGEAAYNELVLLFHENRFEDLVSRASILEPHLEGPKKALFDFCLGRSHFKLEHLSEATSYFEKFIAEEPENTPYKRAAFLTLITCAQQTQNNPLFDRILEQFLTAFPHDEEAAKALLLHAQTALKEGKTDLATTDLGRLLLQFPEFPDKEALLYNHALLLSKSEKWGESRRLFLAYIQQFPQSAQIPMSWVSIVQCSIQELKGAGADTILEKKSQLAADLKEALEKSNLFTPEERAHYQFLLGQLLYDVKHYPESLAALEAFSAGYENHPSVPQALVIQAHLHRELASPPDVFVTVAEKALEKTLIKENQTALRLQLFNSYLTLKNYNKAAEHLYHVYMVDGVPVHQENALWIAHHYYEGAKRGERDPHEKALSLLRRVLMLDDNFALHFDPQQSYLEVEVLKLAELLPITDKKKLLLSLIDFQTRHPAQSWKLQRQALFELGKIHVAQNETEEALKVFEELTASSDLTPSYFSNAALLEKNRILLSRCPDCDRNESNPTISNILSTFKDLQIQRKLACEPLHLEAALEYADLRVSLASPESRLETALFFLNRIKEDFTANDDTIRQEYHEARLRFPDKDSLFQTYMKCIDAEILALEAQIAKGKNDLEISHRSAQNATILFEETLKGASMTPFLKNRVESHLIKLRQ